jgi:glycosyltransferase involved in cell wall biosynthesis
MRILLLANAYPPTYMGGESTHVRDLAGGLAKKGHEVLVVHPLPAPGVNDQVVCSKPAERVTVYRVSSKSGTDRVASVNRILSGLLRAIQKERGSIDILHAHSTLFLEGILEWSRQNRRPVVTTVHAVHTAIVYDLLTRKKGSFPGHEEASYRKDIERQTSLCAASAGIVAISRAMASHAQRYFKCESGKIRLIPHGIDADRLIARADAAEIEAIRKSLSVTKGSVILYAGRIEAMKGVSHLAAVWKKLAPVFPECHAVFLGNGSLDPWLRANLSDTPRTHFVDWVVPERATQYYHLAEVVAVPSLIEPFGLVALEAMACGTCVLASNADGLDEIITHDVNGLKVPLTVDEFGDRDIPKALMQEMLAEALQDDALRKRLSASAKQRSRVFSLEQMISQTERFYLEVGS